VEYSYGAEDDNAHAIGRTNGLSDDPGDNALLITFNVPVFESTLVSENFSIDGTALPSGLTTTYSTANKVLTITIGDDTIDVDATSNSGVTSTVSASSSVKASTGLDLDTLSTSKVVAARKGIMHNGVTYNTVKSPETSKYWLDRNLGATRVATSSTDTAAYGDLYQWGRLHDGHQVRSPLTSNTSNRAISITPDNSNFITNPSAEVDWTQNITQDTTDVDDSGALRSAFLSNVDGTGVCPIGFRAPTDTELGDETINAIETTVVNNAATAFSSFLKLPAAGIRFGWDGRVVNEGWAAHVWSATVAGSAAMYLQAGGGGAIFGSDRADGCSVRCIQE
jgi:uncharacterized protein (TIGR02145 family)